VHATRLGEAVTTSLNGRYRLRRELGRGGMATVWHADDLLLQRPVAVKMLHPDLSGDPVVRHRIRDEALAAAALNHPHIANVYDYGEHPDDHGGLCPYLVMELVDGPTLDARLADAGTLPWRQAAPIAAAVADALAAAHAHGVVHRDIKPGNVILGATGVKVVDFGVAAGVGQDAADANGVVWGTPAYLPPESAADTVATTAGDVYALGLMLTVCLTGRLPSRGASGHVNPVASLPSAARDLMEALLAPDPADRPTAATAARELSAIGTDTRGGDSERVRPSGPLLQPFLGATTVLPATSLTRTRQRRLLRAAVLGGAGLTAAATVVVAVQAAGVGDPAVVGNDTAVQRAVSCAADYAEPSVPRRFAVNDEPCGRVDTRTSTSVPSATARSVPPARQPDRATSATPAPLLTTPARPPAAVDRPSSGNAASPTPASSPSPEAPSPDPVVSATEPPSPAPTGTAPSGTPTGSTKPSATATASRTAVPTATGSRGAAAPTSTASRAPASPSGARPSSNRADMAAADENSGRGVHR
jgi:hypothetical protein